MFMKKHTKTLAEQISGAIRSLLLNIKPFALTGTENPQNLRALAPGRRFLVIEQNTGQMVEDVRLALNNAAPVAWHGVMPGLFIGADALTDPILRALKEKK